MTNQPNLPNPSNDPSASDLLRPGQAFDGAKILDAGDRVLSRGRAILSYDLKEAEFYPHDEAQLHTVQESAKNLLLSASGPKLVIRDILDCADQTDHLVHWHVRFPLSERS